MDFDGALKTFETYAVDFVRYILSVCGRGAFKRRAPDLENKLFTFALISAVLGAFLNMKYVSGLSVGEGDLVTPVVTEFSIWIALSVLVWFGMGLGRRGPTLYTPALSAVLRVLPVAFVLSAYGGFVLTNLAQLWTVPACAPWQAYAGTVAVRFVLIALFMPLSIALVSSHVSQGRAWVVGLAVPAPRPARSRAPFATTLTRVGCRWRAAYDATCQGNAGLGARGPDNGLLARWAGLCVVRLELSAAKCGPGRWTECGRAAARLATAAPAAGSDG